MDFKTTFHVVRLVSTRLTPLHSLTLALRLRSAPAQKSTDRLSPLFIKEIDVDTSYKS